MKFTTKDIADNKELKNFIRTRMRATHSKLVGDNLFNVYETEDVIIILKAMIIKHSKGSNVAKYIPMWKRHIKYLERMSK